MQVLSFSRDNFLTVRLQPPLSHGKSRPVAPSLVECLAHLELAFETKPAHLRTVVRLTTLVAFHLFSILLRLLVQS